MHSFNFRQDSTIVTPYESWQYYDPNVVTKGQNINYAEKKTKKVAWFVSNCGAKNGRLQYAQELAKFIRKDNISLELFIILLNIRFDSVNFGANLKL